MGYCSMMTSSEFTSNLSEAEIQMIFTEHKDIAGDYVVVVLLTTCMETFAV